MTVRHSDFSQIRFMDEKLFKSRAITLFGSIDDKLARSVTERLLALASDGDDPITLYISSPGGHVESGDVIYDMIKFIQPVVKVVGTGWVASAATTIYLAAEKENRFSLPEYPLSGASASGWCPWRCDRYRYSGRADCQNESAD